MPFYKFKDLEVKPLDLPIKSMVTGTGRPIELHPVVVVPKPQINVYGISDTIEAIDLIASLANGLWKVALTGWSVGYITAIWYLAPIIPKLFTGLGGIGNVVDEIDDLSPTEKEQILEAVKDKLVFSDNVEAIVTMALDILYKLKSLAGVFK